MKLICRTLLPWLAIALATAAGRFRGGRSRSEERLFGQVSTYVGREWGSSGKRKPHHTVGHDHGVRRAEVFGLADDLYDLNAAVGRHCCCGGKFAERTVVGIVTVISRWGGWCALVVVLTIRARRFRMRRLTAVSRATIDLMQPGNHKHADNKDDDAAYSRKSLHAYPAIYIRTLSRRRLKR